MKRILFVLALALAGFASVPANAQAHSASFKWTASTDLPGTIPSGSGYNMFRASGVCPVSGIPAGATQLNTTPIAALVFTDSTVQAGSWCYYATTTISGTQSGPSNTVTAAIPVAPPTNVIITGSN